MSTSQPENRSQSHRRPELIIGLIGAIGTNLDAVSEEIQNALKPVKYAATVIKLSSFLTEFKDPPWGTLPETPLEKRLKAYMDAGNMFRNITKRGDALVMTAVARIRALRQGITGNNKQPADGHAYILRSLKTVDEAVTLRRIYGPSFFLISAYSPRSHREDHLARKIMESHNGFHPSEFKTTSSGLVDRDHDEAEDDFGQQVIDTFWRGDIFIDASDPDKITKSIQRLVEMWFGHQFHTPTRDEYLMFHAQAAAYRSASLGRQVGALIATEDGSIISVGANEVPKAGGGVYWPDDLQDARDHRRGGDSSDLMRAELLADIISRLNDDQWLNPDKLNGDVNQAVKSLLDSKTGIMREAAFMNLTEFQRPVHAEMTALTDAARRGVSVAGCTLYCTTFPCHGCAKHIVASGIMRVVYIEPYDKSLVDNLYNDAISVDNSNGPRNMVRFEPFVGLAPRRYMNFFAMTSKRKEKDGNVIKWDAAKATPRTGELGFYPTEYTLYRESEELFEFNQQWEQYLKRQTEERHE